MPGDLAVTEVMFQAPEDTRWIELRNASTCRVDIAHVAVISRRLTPGGADDTGIVVPITHIVDPGERVVFSQHPSFPVVDDLVADTTALGWMFTPEVVFVQRDTVQFQQLLMPENFATTTRYARALPEVTCANVDPNDAETWPLSQVAVSPNTVDPGQTGTPGEPNDTHCP